jgi:hypothetical protein
LGIEGYFRGRNAGGWMMLPDTYWIGVFRLDSFDTWKLPSGLEVGQVRGGALSAPRTRSCCAPPGWRVAAVPLLPATGTAGFGA